MTHQACNCTVNLGFLFSPLVVAVVAQQLFEFMNPLQHVQFLHDALFGRVNVQLKQVHAVHGRDHKVVQTVIRHVPDEHVKDRVRESDSARDLINLIRVVVLVVLVLVGRQTQIHFHRTRCHLVARERITAALECFEALIRPRHTRVNPVLAARMVDTAGRVGGVVDHNAVV